MRKSSLILLFVIVTIAAFLRFYHIDKVPYGLYIDEVSIGYNAHTILHTGKDEYGISYPLFFKSFGDYKQPVYIYFTSAAMAIFGKNDFAVRFPSALFGTLTVLLIYFLVKELLRKRGAVSIALLASFFFAISPWHIHFSRGGFEVNVGLFFYLLGIYGLLLFWNRKKFRYFIIGLSAFIVTLYTYHTYKILTPITWLLGSGLLWFSMKDMRKKIFLSTGVFFLASIPLIQFSLTPEGSMRFAGTSAFSDVKADTLWEKVVLYPMIYLRNYFSFFGPDFLFSHGDYDGRHQIVRMGLIYKWQLPFLIIGFFWLFKQKNNIIKLTILGLLVAAPLVPAVAVPSPHTLRSLVMIVPLTILIAGGVYYTSINVKTIAKWIIFTVVVLLACIEFTLYTHKYYTHYPNVNALDWGAGYKETAIKAVQYHETYPHIVVDNKLDYAELYFHFYAPELQVVYVKDTWVKPADWKSGQVLYIRPFYGNREEPQSIDQVYLPGPKKDIYTQFWKL